MISNEDNVARRLTALERQVLESQRTARQFKTLALAQALAVVAAVTVAASRGPSFRRSAMANSPTSETQRETNFPLTICIITACGGRLFGGPAIYSSVVSVKPYRP